MRAESHFMPTPPPLSWKLAYWLVGARVPDPWRAWVEADIARANWHRFVPRIRIWLVVVIAIAIFSKPWSDEFNAGVVLAIFGVVSLVFIWPAHTSEADRKHELQFQRGLASGQSRFLSLVQSAVGVGEGFNPDAPPQLSEGPSHEHKPEPPPREPLAHRIVFGTYVTILFGGAAGVVGYSCSVLSAVSRAMLDPQRSG